MVTIETGQSSSFFFCTITGYLSTQHILLKQRILVIAMVTGESDGSKSELLRKNNV